jgi:hypothetical protein
MVQVLLLKNHTLVKSVVLQRLFKKYKETLEEDNSSYNFIFFPIFSIHKIKIHTFSIEIFKYSKIKRDNMTEKNNGIPIDQIPKYSSHYKNNTAKEESSKRANLRLSAIIGISIGYIVVNLAYSSQKDEQIYQIPKITAQYCIQNLETLSSEEINPCKKMLTDILSQSQ